MKRLCVLLLVTGAILVAEDGPRNKVAITEWDNVLPQVADGNGWSTRIMLINMGDRAASFTLFFYNEDGTPWNISLKGTVTGPASSWSGTIPVGGSLFLETPGTGDAVRQGWAYLSTQYWVSGMAVFKAAWMPTNDAEAVVPFASEVDVDFFIPFDNRNGYVTSVALVNPFSTGTASITVLIRNPDGSSILTDTIQLGPHQHIAFETTNRWAATQERNGVIEFQVPGGQVAASGLGLLFSPRNTFTSIHTVSIDPYLF